MAVLDAGLDILSVEVGSTSFAPDGPWVEYITDQLLAAFDKSASGIEKTALDFAKKVTEYVVERHGTLPWNGELVNPEPRLQVRSGGTIEKFKAGVTGTADGNGGFEVKHDLSMFGIHLDGGTIVATRSKYLTIPLPAACDRRGVPLKASSRDWPDTFVMTSKRGNLIIAQRGPGKSITPLYLLKTSVRIPARFGDFPAFYDAQVDRLEKTIIQVIEDAIDKIRW